MLAISAQVWWSSSLSISAMVAGFGLPDFPGRLGDRQGEGAVLAAGQADVRGDGVAGPGHGDVGEQQPGDALAFAHRGGGVVPDAGQVGDELGDPVLLGVGELPGVLVAGLVVGGLGVVQGAQGGVPVGFEGAGDEPVGGVDGQVAAAGQVGVVAGALDVGGAQRVGLGGSLLELGGDLEGGLDGQRGEGADQQLADVLVEGVAGDRGADRGGRSRCRRAGRGRWAGLSRRGRGSGRSSGRRSGRR